MSNVVDSQLLAIEVERAAQQRHTHNNADAINKISERDGMLTFGGSHVIGPPGARGERGEQGPPGEVGPPGADGAQGADGQPGNPGLPGVNGLPGADGADGAPGAVGPPGPQGPAGATGATGAQGERGLQGVPGPQGIQGPSGPGGGFESLISVMLPRPVAMQSLGIDVFQWPSIDAMVSDLRGRWFPSGSVQANPSGSIALNPNPPTGGAVSLPGNYLIALPFTLHPGCRLYGNSQVAMFRVRHSI